MRSSSSSLKGNISTRGVPARGTRVGVTGLVATTRSRAAQAKYDDSESRKRRTDDSAKPLLVRIINARVISRSVTALIDKVRTVARPARGSTPPASAARSRANQAWTNRWMNASNPARLQTLGPPLAQGLKGLLAHNVFLGAYGIDDDLDIVDPSSSMAQVKQQYVRMRRMSSSSKIGRIGNTKVMPLERVDILITDDEISPADRKRVAKLDIDLIIADHT
jgi:hypothetical protein